jgi:predicted transposase/invertase (TIGR01784 family)
MIRRHLAKHPAAEKKIMTIAEQLRQEGKQEAERGFMTIAEQSRQEGRQEGRQEERLVLARRLLKSGNDLSFIAEITELSKEEIEEIS